MSLRDELTRLDQEIEKEEINKNNLIDQLALSKARLAGLEEQRRTLAAEVAAPTLVERRARPSSDEDITRLTMTDAIKKIVNSAEASMRISDVVRELRNRGRKDNPNSVSMTLSSLATAGDIQKVARGVYGPLSNDDPV